MSKALEWAISRILDITSDGDFYGSFTLKFERSKPVHLEYHRSEKPPATGG